ncbi:F0F1 ATP synthase subunit B [Palleronia sp.]|uniref:F0F1 ATP synthase subunit B family protein n=1 Tax=Palleronia sp. TaxID=1940284 RepID=UPI0035C84EFD
MSIDWITVGAQIANFLVLVWLLKRFLYRPILDGIEARETEIARRMGAAEEVRIQGEKTKAEFESRVAGLDADRERIRSEVRAAAEAERAVLIAEACERSRREAEASRADRETASRRFAEDLQIRGAGALLALTRKALADLADDDLEQRIVRHAVHRIPSMLERASGIEGGAGRIVVTTQSPLPEALQKQLLDKLAEMDVHAPVSFRTDPAQSPGLSLRIGGTELGWTVGDYLDGLKDALRDNASLAPDRMEAIHAT